MIDQREKRIEIFNDTMKMCRENERLNKAMKNASAGTVLYAADAVHDLSDAKITEACKVSVTDERTFQAAKRLLQEYAGRRATVHNFASATNPGGGVTSGSNAQEEALCRCSVLYPCLKSEELFKNYYSMHRKRCDVRYTDTCIYTPDVTVFKSDTSAPEALPENEWYTVDVITCAAPNLRMRPYNSMNPGKGGAVSVTDAELMELHIKRGRQVLGAAAANGADVLVLGAFGCGAFRNDPLVVAQAYRKLLDEYRQYFENITFAVYCPPDKKENFNIFKRILN
ncbi:MAG: TIGR02452 family protein [Oscillospiraceae bacterium]|nr:TIGR02452 family protein [Oscillospiraceae bacterium]